MFSALPVSLRAYIRMHIRIHTHIITNTCKIYRERPMAWGGGSVLGQARGTCAEMSASGGDGPLWGWGSAWGGVTLWRGVSVRQLAHLVHLRLVSSRPFLKEKMGE